MHTGSTITALLGLVLLSDISLMPALADLAGEATRGEQQVREYGYQIVHTYPHDIKAFTQGLKFHAGHLYESTGLYGQSSLRRLDIETGKVLQQKDLPSRYFGEGIEIVGSKIYQLTWRSNHILVHDLETFEELGSHYNPTEGWGLAWDGKFLILSDGSALLRFLDPESMATRRRVQVKLNGKPVTGLNELEFIEGEIWANVLGADNIMRIDPVDGRVKAIVKLTGLAEQTQQGGDQAVLNGIAWDAMQKRLFVTGKLWSNLFEIRLVSLK